MSTRHPETETTVTVGATEALFSVIQAVIGPSDEAIVFDPAYDSYEPAVRLAGGRCVIFWGAGLEGKPLLRALQGAGVNTPYVVEMDERKIGNVIHGAAVIGLPRLDAALAERPDALVLVAVGVPTARPLIRAALCDRQLREGNDFFFLC